jgi:hypothetical protein
MSPNNSVPSTFLVVMNRDLLSHILLQSAQEGWAAAMAAQSMVGGEQAAGGSSAVAAVVRFPTGTVARTRWRCGRPA